jgi:hypothetical protein
MVQFTETSKPTNARYRAKATLFPDGVVEVVPDQDYASFPHEIDQAEIAWYDDRVKITFKGGAPAVITQAYLTGKGNDLIVEVMPRP